MGLAFRRARCARGRTGSSRSSSPHRGATPQSSAGTARLASLPPQSSGVLNGVAGLPPSRSGLTPPLGMRLVPRAAAGSFLGSLVAFAPLALAGLGSAAIIGIGGYLAVRSGAWRALTRPWGHARIEATRQVATDPGIAVSPS